MVYDWLKHESMSSMALTASDRIKILKAIAGSLAAEDDWPIIDLTLTQFGLPTNDVWSGTMSGYVIAMTKDADDSTIEGIADHLGIELSKPKSPHETAAPSFWKPGMFRLFISHLATKRVSAANLQKALEKYGISAFVAHNDIEPAAEWQTQIELALLTCDGLVAMLHQGFHDSNWTDQEIGFAMGRGVPVFSIRLGQDPYGFIGKFQAFNGTGKNAAVGAQEIFDALRKHKQTHAQFAEILVTMFERSPNYESAKVQMGYLEELQVWSPQFSKRIIKASEENSQIEESWGVPIRVEALVKKWSGKA